MLQFPTFLVQSIHQIAQQSSFVVLQEVKPKVRSQSLRQSGLINDLWLPPFSPSHPLPFQEALGWPVLAGGYSKVGTAGAMGHSAMTRINDTYIGKEITMLYEGRQDRRITRWMNLYITPKQY